MKINVALIKSAFYFLEDLVLTKNNSTEVDLSDRADGFIQGLVSSILGGIVEADIQAEDLLRFVKDPLTRVGLQKQYGFVQDVMKVVEFVEEVVAEVLDVEYEEDEKEEVQVDIAGILDGSVKQVLEKIRSAKLSEVDTETVLELEKANKNRATIIAALTEV